MFVQDTYTLGRTTTRSGCALLSRPGPGPRDGGTARTLISPGPRSLRASLPSGPRARDGGTTCALILPGPRSPRASLSRVAPGPWTAAPPARLSCPVPVPSHHLLARVSEFWHVPAQRPRRYIERSRRGLSARLYHAAFKRHLTRSELWPSMGQYRIPIRTRKGTEPYH